MGLDSRMLYCGYTKSFTIFYIAFLTQFHQLDNLPDGFPAVLFSSCFSIYLTAICQLFVICFPAVRQLFFSCYPTFHKLLANFMPAVCKIIFNCSPTGASYLPFLLLFASVSFRRLNPECRLIVFGSQQNESKNNLVLHQKLKLAHPSQIILLLSYLKLHQQGRKKYREKNSLHC